MSEKLTPNLLELILGDPDNLPALEEEKFNTGPIGIDPDGLGFFAAILGLLGLGFLGFFTGIFDAIINFFGSLF